VLKWAIENGAKRLRVVSDSELMVKQMKGKYKVKSPGLRPLWEEAKRRAAASNASRCATPCAAATRKPTGWPTKPWIGGWGFKRKKLNLERF
jgi:ribonuclease HI